MAVITSNIVKTTLPKHTVAYISHTGPYKGDTELFGNLFNKVMEWAAPKGILQNPHTQSVSIYQDEKNIPEDQQTIKVGFTVPEDTETEGPIKKMELPGGEYVVGSFELDPSEYGDAWKEMYEFIHKNNMKPTSEVMYESYKNDPSTHPEGKHLVDICIAL
ncbi:AraC family transcriptional regulator [Spongiivirga citrea]|uniref:Transcriptional regulator n=1 Tax=Spongiivirga citrea TaxID=1481457 RepID=A0A6M0CKB0_9FLAO|nr:GyrI-like domain-containing protein [Spongiivirga citrea]NER17413.1 transcriptional regulator [Spongiivirga citrea]